MKRRHLFSIAVFTILLVVLVTAGWEFLLEEYFSRPGKGYDLFGFAQTGPESAAVHWEHVLTAGLVAMVAVTVTGLASLRVIGRHEAAKEALRENKDALQGRVAELEQAQEKTKTQGDDLMRLAVDLRMARDQA